MKPYLLLILLVVATYANSLQNQFVWDDKPLIADNPKINLPLKELPSVFITPLWKMAGSEKSAQLYYRPVLSLFYVLNYKIWGPNPLGFHLSNIFLHLIIAIILYKIGLILFSDMKISLLAASIFAVHPVNNEPIGRVACGEVIFGFFLILSLYFFLKEKRYLSFITYFLALLSKESAVMLPFALLILTIHKDGVKKGIAKIIPYLVLVGIYLILRSISFDIVVKYEIKLSIFTRILTMIVAAFDYIRLLTIPYQLSPFYPSRGYVSIFGVKAISAIIVLAIVFLIAFRIRKDRVMLFLLLFPLIMLAPVIWKVNTFPINYELVYIAERFLYVPLMLFSLFVSAFVIRLTANIRKQYVMIMWITVIIIFATATASSNMIWKDDFTLFSTIVMTYPKAAFAHNNLGNAYTSYGRLDEAIKEYLIAKKLKPKVVIFYNNLGLAYAMQNRFDEAIKEFLTAIKLDSNYADAHYNLGLVYKEKGLDDEANREFEMALKINPDHTKARKALEEK